VQHHWQAAEIRQAARFTTANPQMSQIAQIFFLLTIVTHARDFQEVLSAGDTVRGGYTGGSG
jgi:hypothetical protein